MRLTVRGNSKKASKKLPTSGPPTEDDTPTDGLIRGEVQLILAEKRTSLAALRTGIAILALPISVLSLLVVTSKYYALKDTVHFLIPLVVINGLLVALGLFMVLRSTIRIHREDKLIQGLKRKNAKIAEFID